MELSNFCNTKQMVLLHTFKTPPNRNHAVLSRLPRRRPLGHQRHRRPRRRHRQHDGRLTPMDHREHAAQLRQGRQLMHLELQGQHSLGCCHRLQVRRQGQQGLSAQRRPCQVR